MPSGTYTISSEGDPLARLDDNMLLEGIKDHLSFVQRNQSLEDREYFKVLLSADMVSLIYRVNKAMED